MTVSSLPLILNLAGEMPETLTEYFVSRGVPVVGANHKAQPTHILLSDRAQLEYVAETYRTVEENIKIIFLGDIEDEGTFLSCNGQLALSPTWLSGPLGSFILDKYFQEYPDLLLGNKDATFREMGSFKVVNPFSTGDYLDRCVFAAFQSGLNTLSIKTYFDHLLIYLTHQKALGRVGLPFEVSYGTFGEVFGVQVHFWAPELELRHLIRSLSQETKSSSPDYGLSVALKNCGFFDFIYL